jgi:hypothetical protein
MVMNVFSCSTGMDLMMDNACQASTGVELVTLQIGEFGDESAVSEKVKSCILLYIYSMMTL